MAKSSRANEQENQEADAELEKRISDRYNFLYRTQGQALEDIFALLPLDKCLEFKAEIETNADRNIPDIIIDFFLKEGIPFKNIQDASAVEEHKDSAAAAAVVVPDPHSAEIKRYVEDSLKNYAGVVELRLMPEGAKETKILQFKDKNEAIKALTSALQDLLKAQNEFKSILVSEKEINELLKSKAAEKVIEKVSAHYNNDTVSQMLEVSKYLENKAELVKQIINSEHIQAAITPEALNSERKLSLDWVRGAMDSSAALKKFVTKAQMEAQTTTTECNLCKPRFNELQTKVTEVFETQKYGEILPNLINQISPSKHQVILRAGAKSLKSSVFEAIKYLVKNGSIKPVGNAAHYKTNEARIEGSAGRICEQLQKFNAEAQARILERTAEEMVITSNPLTLLKLTVNPDRKRGFNHFMEEFNKACAVEEKTYPENVLKKPVELNDNAKAGVKEMCEKLDKEFTATFKNASKPRPSTAEIVKFAAKRVAYNLVTNTAMQGLALGAVGSALEAGRPALAGALGADAAKLLVGAGLKGVEGGQRVLELKKKGHSTKIAGMITAAEAGIEVVIPTLGLDAGSQAAFKSDFLSAVDKFAEELQKPQTLQLIEAAAENKPIDNIPESALIEGAAAGAIVSARAKPNSKEPGEAAKKILVERMMNIALAPLIQKLPEKLATNEKLKEKINEFCKPHVEEVVNMVVAKAKTRLGKALTPKERAEVDEAARVSEVAIPKIAEAAADHVSDAAAVLIANQASSRPAPAAQAVALASIVAAGNIAREAGVDPKVINTVANAVGRAAGLPIGKENQAHEPHHAAARRPSILRIEEENPALAAQARAAVEEVNIRNNPEDRKNNAQGLPPQQKQRSRSF